MAARSGGLGRRQPVGEPHHGLDQRPPLVPRFAQLGDDFAETFAQLDPGAGHLRPEFAESLFDPAPLALGPLRPGGQATIDHLELGGGFLLAGDCRVIALAHLLLARDGSLLARDRRLPARHRLGDPPVDLCPFVPGHLPESAKRGRARCAWNGLGGLRHLDTGVAEVKSMYVSPGHRGAGLGRTILARLERIAAEHGCRAVRLDTSSYLTEAIALYRSAGYAEVADYNRNPKADLWFERQL